MTITLGTLRLHNSSDSRTALALASHSHSQNRPMCNLDTTRGSRVSPFVLILRVAVTQSLPHLTHVTVSLSPHAHTDGDTAKRHALMDNHLRSDPAPVRPTLDFSPAPLPCAASNVSVLTYLIVMRTEYATVTRSVTIDMLRASPALRLAPANASREPKKAKQKVSGKKTGKR